MEPSPGRPATHVPVPGPWDSPKATEARNPKSYRLDTMSTLEIVSLMNQEDAEVVRAVGAVLPEIARAAELVADRLRAGGRVYYVGAGTSGRIGALDAAEWRPTFGVEPDTVQAVLAGGERTLRAAAEEAEDDEEAGRQAMLERVKPGDVVVGLAASGDTPFVMGALRGARERGAVTIGVACNRPAGIEPLVDVAILPVPGAEVLTGSTRLKAGTAQKMVLNMISTAAMVRLGKVYENLMVDMRPTNRKLVKRALRAIQQATGAPEEQVAQAFEAAGHEVKTAIVMLLAGVGVDEARALLHQAGGWVRQAVAFAGRRPTGSSEGRG
ncbi:MAG: N-acetylmuramic acid 6-phosphate etherase [Limnochordaceae bacterium]|nr:N-acetylmuramic acid 6-phosphate etherase [Limnochordaceae bacterium]